MQRHSKAIFAFLSILASTQGCAYGGAGDGQAERDGDEGEIAESSDAILGGAVVSEQNSGIVKLVFGAIKCSGALLSNQWVLTAKQCVDNASLQGNPGQLTVSMDGQSSSAIEIILVHNRDVALVRTLPFMMFGSTTGFERTTFRGAVANRDVFCQGYGIGAPNGVFGTLRTATLHVAQNGTLVPNAAGVLPAAGDTGGVCFIGSIDGRLLPAAVISTCTAQSCALTPMNLVRGWLGVTRTVQELVATNSGKCVEVPNFSFTSGAGITQRTCTNSHSQKWRFEHMGGQDYRIRAKHDGYCLTVPSGGGAATQVVQAPCASGNINQYWYITPSNGSAVIQGAPGSSASGLCLDVRAISVDNDAAIQVYPCNGGTNQLFSVRVEPEEGAFELANGGTAKCMEVPGADMDEADMVQNTCDMGLDQLYRFERPSGTPGGTLVVHPAHSGLCVDLEGGNMSAGTPIQQWSSCNGQSNQRWRLLFSGDGNYQLMSTLSGMCASVPSGNAITQQSCSFSSNNAWKLAN